MAGRIFLGSSVNFHPRSYNPSNLWGCCRFYSQYIAAKVHSLGDSKAQVGVDSRMQAKEVRFIGSERLRQATPNEIQNDPKLLQELRESYEMMAQDEEVAEATDFCARVMLNRRSSTKP